MLDERTAPSLLQSDAELVRDFFGIHNIAERRKHEQAVYDLDGRRVGGRIE